MSNIVLSVRNLTKKYGDKYAVNKISFDLYEGEIFGLLGLNGAGKTTALKTIAGLIKMTDGDAIICGESLKLTHTNALKNLGYVPDNFNMFGNLSGLDNLKLCASLYKKVGKKEIEKVVDLLQIEDILKKKFSTYSYGMRVKLCLAQAILHSPRLLILDEPNGLDVESKKIVFSALKTLAEEGTAIIISSHNLDDIKDLCGKIGIMKDGKLVSVKNIDEMASQNTVNIKVNFPNYAGKLIGENFNPKKISIIGNVLNVVEPNADVPTITMFLVSHGLAIYSIQNQEVSLQDAFLTEINRYALPFNNKGGNDA